ncbi:MAG: manganese/zinc/iron transport system substrate-binding protein, partial [Flavobacteriaceae bacterium]
MKKYLLILVVSTALIGCKKDIPENDNINVVTTTSMITDLVKNIGGKHINIQGLMGSG